MPSIARAPTINILPPAPSDAASAAQKRWGGTLAASLSLPSITASDISAPQSARAVDANDLVPVTFKEHDRSLALSTTFGYTDRNLLSMQAHPDETVLMAVLCF